MVKLIMLLFLAITALTVAVSSTAQWSAPADQGIGEIAGAGGSSAVDCSGWKASPDDAASRAAASAGCTSTSNIAAVTASGVYEVLPLFRAVVPVIILIAIALLAWAKGGQIIGMFRAR